MSSLNSEATKELLLESDILSTSGKISSIWDLFTKNVNFDNEDNDVLKVVLSSIKTSIIDKLNYGNDDLDECITQLKSMVNELKELVEPSVLLAFLMVLAESLSDYVTINSKSDANIQINMSEVDKDVSQLDEMKILSTMERYGLLDSNELQSLIDDRSHTIATACSDINRRWGKDSPSTEGSDVAKNPMLSLDDFIPNLEKVKLNVRGLIVDLVDWFPNTPSEMVELIGPREELDSRRFYHPKCYLANLANFKVLTATSQFICNLFEMDTETAIYVLCSVDKCLNEIIGQSGPVSSIVFSQMMIRSMLLRYIMIERGNDTQTTVTTVEKLRDQLSMLVNSLDRDGSSVFNSQTEILRISNLVDEYVEFVSSTSESISNPDIDKKPMDSFSLSDESLDDALNELLFDLDEIFSEVTAYSQRTGTMENVKGTLGALSSPTIMQDKGQVSESISLKKQETGVITQCAETIHNELNQGLLNGNLESAANSIAREKALMSVIESVVMDTGVPNDGLQTIKECIERDVTTYSGLLKSVPGGISKYEQSAQSYVTDMLKTKRS
jgi:hypothetical protein